MNRQKKTHSKKAMTIARLLSTRQWDLLETLLSSVPASSVPIDDPSLPRAVTSDIVIHFATRFQAPFHVVSALARAYPRSLSSSDETGRYPVHVAAKWAATPDVIAFLIEANPAAAGVPDSTGKTPMHYVGEFYLRHFASATHSRGDSMLQVVQLLKGAAPRSVNLEDDEGMNAIEYALESDADIKVIKTMQCACRDDWRERSKGSSCPMDAVCNADGDRTTEAATAAQRPQQLGRRRHQDLVRDMETMALNLQREYIRGMGMCKDVSGGDRVHVHRSTTLAANTRAARTA